jgi:uncharacterized YccA/Bax inhibitor family protein
MCTSSVPGDRVVFVLLCDVLQLFSGNAAAVMGTLGAAKACGVVGLLAVVASMFKPTWAPFTAPTYALCKGVAMAGMSAVLEMSYPGRWQAATISCQ